jgi:hypothetical protein
VFEHNCAFGFRVEGQDRVPAKFLHVEAQPATGIHGEQVTMKRLPGQGARDRAIRTDDPQVESQLLHDWQGKGVAPSRDYDDLDSFRIGPA